MEGIEAAAPKRQAIGKATERIRDQIEESLYRRQTAQGLRARRLHRYVGTISSGRIEGKQRSCRYLRYSATEMSLTLRTSRVMRCMWALRPLHPLLRMRPGHTNDPDHQSGAKMPSA